MSVAETIVKLCERFGCLPSALLVEDSALLRWVDIADRGRIETPGVELPGIEELLAAQAFGL